MKLKLNETLDQALQRLITRTKKPSFNKNRGLTKIQQSILLHNIYFLKLLTLKDKSLNKSKNKSKPSITQVHKKKSE